MHHKCGIAREHARSYYYYLAQTKQQHLCAQALQHGHGVSLVKQMERRGERRSTVPHYKHMR